MVLDTDVCVLPSKVTYHGVPEGKPDSVKDTSAPTEVGEVGAGDGGVGDGR
jgi:hypothetical protein